MVTLKFEHEINNNLENFTRQYLYFTFWERSLKNKISKEKFDSADNIAKYQK